MLEYHATGQIQVSEALPKMLTTFFFASYMSGKSYRDRQATLEYRWSWSQICRRAWPQSLLVLHPTLYMRTKKTVVVNQCKATLACVINKTSPIIGLDIGSANVLPHQQNIGLAIFVCMRWCITDSKYNMSDYNVNNMSKPPKHWVKSFWVWKTYL